MGGKRGLLRQLGALFPKEPWDLYIEPFLGSGAVFFHLVSSLFFHRGPTQAVLIDKNPELINFYRVLRDNPEELLIDLRRHENTPEYFKRMRALNPKELTPVQRASRFLYLNAASFGGLWEESNSGRLHVPYGHRKRLGIDEANLRLVSKILARPEVYLVQGDYRLALFWAGPGTFIYLDPPYYPVSSHGQVRYTRDDFVVGGQMRLAKVFRELDRRGCLVMLSNSDTPFIRQLYAGYDIRRIYTRYSINRWETRRRLKPELVIRNYRN